MPAVEDGFQRAFFVSGGRVAAARPPRRGRRPCRDRGGSRCGRPCGGVARPGGHGRAPLDRRLPPPAAARVADRAARESPTRRVALRPWRPWPPRRSPTGSVRRSQRKRSQLVVGLDPRLDLLPVELRGGRALGRAEAANACARFCCGIVDAVGRYVVAVKPQTAFFEALGADGFAALERVCAYARSAGLLVIADGKRGDIGSTARACRRVSRAPRRGAGACGCAHRQHLSGRRLGRSRSCRHAACTERDLLSRAHFELGRRRRAGAHALRRPPGVAARRGARRGVGRGPRRRARPRASARSSARPSHVRSPRRGSSCRSRCCSCRAWARRAQLRPMSRAPSRAGPRARSRPHRAP